MLPEIGTIEIADCLVYDPDSVEEYVAKLKATIADLQAKLDERDSRYVILRSDGFYLMSLRPTGWGRGNSQTWTRKIEDAAPCLYEEAQSVLAFLDETRMPLDGSTFQAVKVLPKDKPSLPLSVPTVGVEPTHKPL